MSVMKKQLTWKFGFQTKLKLNYEKKLLSNASDDEPIYEEIPEDYFLKKKVQLRLNGCDGEQIYEEIAEGHWPALEKSGEEEPIYEEIPEDDYEIMKSVDPDLDEGKPDSSGNEFWEVGENPGARILKVKRSPENIYANLQDLAAAEPIYANQSVDDDHVYENTTFAEESIYEPMRPVNVFLGLVRRNDTISPDPNIYEVPPGAISRNAVRQEEEPELLPPQGFQDYENVYLAVTKPKPCSSEMLQEGDPASQEKAAGTAVEQNGDSVTDKKVIITLGDTVKQNCDMATEIDIVKRNSEKVTEEEHKNIIVTLKQSLDSEVQGSITTAVDAHVNENDSSEKEEDSTNSDGVLATAADVASIVKQFDDMKDLQANTCENPNERNKTKIIITEDSVTSPVSILVPFAGLKTQEDSVKQESDTHSVATNVSHDHSVVCDRDIPTQIEPVSDARDDILKVKDESVSQEKSSTIKSETVTEYGDKSTEIKLPQDTDLANENNKGTEKVEGTKELPNTDVEKEHEITIRNELVSLTGTEENNNCDFISENNIAPLCDTTKSEDIRPKNEVLNDKELQDDRDILKNKNAEGNDVARGTDVIEISEDGTWEMKTVAPEDLEEEKQSTDDPEPEFLCPMDRNAENVKLTYGSQYYVNLGAQIMKKYEEDRQKLRENLPDVSLLDVDASLEDIQQERRRIIDNQAVRAKRIDSWIKGGGELPTAEGTVAVPYVREKHAWKIEDVSSKISCKENPALESPDTNSVSDDDGC